MKTLCIGELARPVQRTEKTGEALPDYHSFWTGRQRLPTEIEPATPAAVPAILVRKAGDFPAFWGRDSSFVAVMEEVYQRVREKNREVL